MHLAAPAEVGARLDLVSAGFQGYLPRLIFWLVAPLAIAVVVVVIGIIHVMTSSHAVLKVKALTVSSCTNSFQRRAQKRDSSPHQIDVADSPVDSHDWCLRKPFDDDRITPTATTTPDVWSTVSRRPGNTFIPGSEPSTSSSRNTKRKQQWSLWDLIDVVAPWLLWLFFLAAPFASAVAFEGFPCYAFDDGTKWLKADVTVPCESDAHREILAWSLITIIIYPIGNILLTAVLLCCVRGDVKGRRVTNLWKATTFLHRDYATDWFFWELLEM